MGTNEQGWISAIDAVHLIAPQVGGDKAAKMAIFERLKDCAIRAKVWWVAYAADFGEPYISPIIVTEWEEADGPPQFSEEHWKIDYRARSKPSVSETCIGDGQAFLVFEDCNLGPAFWNSVSKKDLKKWDWYSGFCIATHAPTAAPLIKEIPKKFAGLPIRNFALGLEFAKADILKIAQSPNPNTPMISHSKRGRPASSRTAHWVAELIVLHDEMGIQYWHANKVVDSIANKLSLKGLPELSHSSAHMIAQEVLEALREAAKKQK